MGTRLEKERSGGNLLKSSRQELGVAWNNPVVLETESWERIPQMFMW